MEDKNVKYNAGDAGVIESQEDLNRLHAISGEDVKTETTGMREGWNEEKLISALDQKWPHLTEGQTVWFMDAPFIVRLNASSVVLRPESGKYSARHIMDKIRQGENHVGM